MCCVMLEILNLADFCDLKPVSSVEEARISNAYERQKDDRKNNNLPVIIQKLSK